MSRRRGPLRRALRFAVRLALLAVGLAVLWAALYRVANPPTTVLIETERWRLGRVERSWRPLGAISPHLVRAVIAAEDARFCAHGGFDLQAIRAAWADRQSGRAFRGGSTITQQTAKNAFLWPGQSWTRKALEAGFAALIEPLWGKRRIMEVYLNVAEFGPGLFGAEAAARRWFGKSADRLSLAEASRLAMLLPSPRTRSATKPTAFQQRRARAIAEGAETLRATGGADCAR